MILVAFLRVMPGMTFLRITTTCGIECSQSLYKMTFQGRSGLAFLRVWVPSALLICVALISWEPFRRLVPCASSHRLFIQLGRKLTSQNTNKAKFAENPFQALGCIKGERPCSTVASAARRGVRA